MKIEFLKSLGGAGLVALLAGSAIANTPDTVEERITSLEAELQEAKAQQTQMLRQAELDQMVTAAADDAATRSFFQGGPATLSYLGNGKGFLLSDEGGNNTMNIGWYNQFRYNANFQDDDSADPNVDGFNTGFQFARARLWMKGKLMGDFDYKIVGDFGGYADGDGRNDGFTLKDFYVDWNMQPDLKLRVGQFKARFMWETLGSATEQLAVERSTEERIFGAGRTQGTALIYTGFDCLVISGGMNDGIREDNTDWNSGENEFAISGRIDWVAMGEYDQFKSLTANRSADTGLRIGFAALYQDGDVGDSATVGSNKGPWPNVFTCTVDGQFEYQGWSVYAMGLYNANQAETPGNPDADNYAILVQTGFYLTDEWELFGRWEYIDFDDNVSSNDEFSLFTFGTNYYVNGQANKLSADVGFSTDSIGAATANDRGVLEVDRDGDDYQFFLRFQWQLMF